MDYKSTLFLVLLSCWGPVKSQKINSEKYGYYDTSPEITSKNEVNNHNSHLQSINTSKKYFTEMLKTMQERVPHYFNDIKSKFRQEIRNDIDTEQQGMVQNKNAPPNWKYNKNLNQVQGVPTINLEGGVTNETKTEVSTQGSNLINWQNNFEDELYQNKEIKNQWYNTDFNTNFNQKVLDMNPFDPNTDMVKGSDGYGTCSCCGSSTHTGYDPRPKSLVININSDCSAQPTGRLVHKYIFRPNFNQKHSNLHNSHDLAKISSVIPGITSFYY